MTNALPKRVTRDVGLALLCLLLFGLVSLRFAAFASLDNVSRLLDDTAILMLLAIGQMLVILTRGIDLSVAANVAFTGMSVALINHAQPDLDVAWILLIAIAIGALLGAANGLLVWLLRIPPIVVTLGTLAIYRGFVYVLSGGAWVTSGAMSPQFLGFVRSTFAGLTTLSWIAIFGIGGAALWLRFTEAGRRFFVAGSNPVAALYAGIDVGRTQFVAFTISGAIAGLCGYLWVSRFAVAYTDVAQGFELQVIAACVIGGVSIAGGIGTIAGIALGSLFLGIIKNALPLIGVSPFWQTAVSGAVIVVAVILNARRSGAAMRRILERPAT